MTTPSDFAGMSASELAVLTTVWARSFPPKDWQRCAVQVAEAFGYDQLALAEMRNLLAEWAAREDTDTGLEQETWAHRRHPNRSREQTERYLAKAALGLGGTIKAMAKEMVPASMEVAQHSEHIDP